MNNLPLVVSNVLHCQKYRVIKLVRKSPLTSVIRQSFSILFSCSYVENVTTETHVSEETNDIVTGYRRAERYITIMDTIEKYASHFFDIMMTETHRRNATMRIKHRTR